MLTGPVSCRCLLFGRPADEDLAADLEAAGLTLAAQIQELPLQQPGSGGSALPPTAAELCAMLAAANGEVRPKAGVSYLEVCLLPEPVARRMEQCCGYRLAP